ncbi:hypothetical protein [Domibacillus indicus]|uniref:hypothetical protein n=1 Tax=Domibacillus indicus TaxID=1437523 RepID=UPI00203FB76F|nr:hypothetical protein [Domibacillus indicus]
MFALKEVALLLSVELERLVDDYLKCPDLIIKEQIQNDIQLLSEALVQCKQPI